MYNTDIQTTLSLRGHIIFIEYQVSKEHAVEWWPNYGVYEKCSPTFEALEALTTLMRTHESDRIEGQLLTEFLSRQYAMEQAIGTKGNEDVPF